MAGHKPGVGGTQGLVADEILAHPGEAIPAQGRNVGPDHWLEADVATLCDPGGGEADLEISNSGTAFVHMGEAIGKIDASADFKEDVGQIALGQPCLNIATLRSEARWFFKPVEMGQDKTVVLETQVWILRKVCVRPLVGGVKLFAEAADLDPCILGASEGPKDCRPCRCPGGVFEHAPIRVGEPGARCDEDIASLQCLARGLKHGEHIGAGVRDPRTGLFDAVSEDMSAPSGADAGGRRGPHRRPGPVWRVGKERQRFAHWLGTRRRLKCDAPEQPLK